MGRAKSNMEFIKKENLRNRTFQQKNKIMKKKIYELATLCDVKAVVITYGPKKDTTSAHPLEPEIWPQNRDEVLELINKYKGQSPEDRRKRTSLLSDFFKERIQKAQQALTKQHNDNVESKYPTRHSRFDAMTEEDLRKSVVSLENVIGNARAKLEQMKARAYQVQQHHQQIMLCKKRKMDFEAENYPGKHLKINPHGAISDPVQVPILMPYPIHQQRPPFINNNWNQMMVKFENECAGGTSNIVHNTPLSKNVYNYPTMAGTLQSVSYGNNLARAPLYYYGEGRQLIAPHILQYRPIAEGFNSHQMVPASQQYFGDRKWQR
ncbi:MADS-box domain-containing protein [Heracleum sosnowskyi]|uniref:MADS-box domain-containing protein n=1 Tax=Heracleum sosnowskyi TaxID=360622 RepID=A0AAD8HUT1_9APIA|nr:MADS-box domain-containing protein [Heracleum sosnowskyi]